VSAVLRAAAAAAAMAVVVAMTGCATQATDKAMTVRVQPDGGKHHPYSVSVVTSGGAETSSFGSSNIGNPELKAAIENSMRDSHLFRTIVQGKDGQFQLSVVVIQMSKPSFGLDFTVGLEAGWSLIRTSDNKVVLRQVIKSSHTATMGDAFAGVKRLQLAVEGAARANIMQGLAAIAALVLEGEG
jgi:hypothetical protein